MVNIFIDKKHYNSLHHYLKTLRVNFNAVENNQGYNLSVTVNDYDLCSIKLLSVYHKNNFKKLGQGLIILDGSNSTAIFNLNGHSEILKITDSKYKITIDDLTVSLFL